MFNPLVSVIIPAYNHENYIQETINSIINQTYQNIELIILDDGSKDSTFQKIQDMKEICENRFVNIHFETKKNEGICVTLNKLISLSNGEFIYLIASDDVAKPQAIERELEFLVNNKDYALCVGDNEIIDGKSKVCFWGKHQNIIYEKDKAKYYTFAQFLEFNTGFKFISSSFGTYKELYKGNHIPNGYLLRKSIFDIIDYYTKEAPLEDWYIMLQISKYAKMKFIDEILFSYRWHDNNTVRDTEKIRAYSILTRKYEAKISENILKSKEKSQMLLPEVISVIKHGTVYKRLGIPFVFEILSCFINGNKYKKIKLFNIPICSIKKKEKVNLEKFISI